jgi:hypothetical protein
MKKSILIYSFLIVTLVFFSRCQTIGLSSPKNTIEIITYGTSFGHCVGLNCNKTYTISKEEIAFTKKGNGDTRDSLVRRAAIETEQWDNLINAVNDANISNLPVRIGCPDCADGGSEWLEINEKGSIKRITFEYGRTPDELKSVVKILKRLTEAFKEEN